MNTHKIRLPVGAVQRGSLDELDDRTDYDEDIADILLPNGLCIDLGFRWKSGANGLFVVSVVSNDWQFTFEEFLFQNFLDAVRYMETKAWQYSGQTQVSNPVDLHLFVFWSGNSANHAITPKDSTTTWQNPSFSCAAPTLSKTESLVC